MKIGMLLTFNEKSAVSLLNWLARENARVIREHRDLPLLYDSGVVYRREQDETWCDVLHTLARGYEDCDGLAAIRAGELLARGYTALRPGDGGFAEARALRLERIEAQVLLLTRGKPGEPALYHCVTRYPVGGRWYQDDPSARLGMNGQIPEDIRARWASRTGQGQWRTQ